MPVSRYFTNVLKSPPWLDWKGKRGTFSLIHACFPSILYEKIMQAVNDTAYCKDRNKIYDDKKTTQHKGPYLIQPGGAHEKILVDCIKTSISLKHTTLLLNKELRKDDRTEVGVSCVR